MSRHACHWPDCAVVVPADMWGCKAHWFALPRRLRAKLDARISKGTPNRPSAAYIAAEKAVQEWIAEQIRCHRSRTHRTEVVGYSPFEPPITREVPIPDPDEDHDDE